MARLQGPKHRMCRRTGEKLCSCAKCPVTKRNYPPGMHGPKGKPRLTTYGLQLQEKQKAKYTYRLMEKQFRKYFETANAKEGDTGELFVQLLESRLDNVVYRLGLAATRDQARQLVGHKHILVNDKVLNIPSYQVKADDKITVDKKIIDGSLMKERVEALKSYQAPGWLSVDPKKFEGKVIAIPTSEELNLNFDTKIIVEFYSR